MLNSKFHNVVCRPITDDVIGQVIECLKRGFPHRPKSYWVGALDQLSKRPAIEDYPRYGFALQVEDHIVGVVLLIYSRLSEGAESYIRCNICSWCVDSEYRASAILLHMAAVKRKEVTYLNIAPANHTRPAIEALGFRRFSDGRILSMPILSHGPRDVRVRAFSTDGPEAALLSKVERQLLQDHADLGCISFTCVKDDLVAPFVFQRRVALGFIRCSHLIYCRSTAEFVRFAGPIGRYLFFRTGPFSIVDAMSSVKGLPGLYFADRNPNYFKGPVTPRSGDLSYTEMALFGP